MALDSTQLRYFLEVGTLGSIKAAAQTLHITQSALSRRMVKLETDIGKPLFIRSHVGVELSQVGRELMQRAIELTSLLEQIGQIGQMPLPPDQSRTLHLGMVSSASSLLLEKVVVRFAKVCPDVFLRIEGLTDQPLSVLGLEIKVGRSETSDSAVNCTTLWKEALLLVTSRTAKVRELRRMTFIEAAKSPQIRRVEKRILAEHGLDPNRRIEVWPASEAIRIVDDNAYTILPYSLLAAHNRLNDFKIIPARTERLSLDLCVLKSAAKRPEYRALMAVIKDVANEFLRHDRSGYLIAPGSRRTPA
ncbi:LysR family transcriptional regulator [Bradyrhizobium sp. CNPSo 4010]|uniref:LysR family transcriptional regulator n=1 Tax=Bradyrhizobium agreste TaxID=2751811 RepID=A0ABS0PJK4_9BRAD|nr:LysR family transcriptional regulator [Bradyrhizobium agreste]MBH5397250.1 LysR family transcriptional regulator [Bradyrhizobium agreste]